MSQTVLRKRSLPAAFLAWLRSFKSFLYIEEDLEPPLALTGSVDVPYEPAPVAPPAPPAPLAESIVDHLDVTFAEVPMVPKPSNITSFTYKGFFFDEVFYTGKWGYEARGHDRRFRTDAACLNWAHKQTAK